MVEGRAILVGVVDAVPHPLNHGDGGAFPRVCACAKVLEDGRDKKSLPAFAFVYFLWERPPGPGPRLNLVDVDRLTASSVLVRERVQRERLTVSIEIPSYSLPPSLPSSSMSSLSESISIAVEAFACASFLTLEEGGCGGFERRAWE